jgi:hypothetical protein
VGRLIGAITGLGLAAFAVGSAAAQTAQRFSFQASGLYANLYGDAFDGVERGLGGEAQLRYTPSALSIGAGFQYTDHNTLEIPGTSATFRLYGGFLEPRYVIDVGSQTFAPYVSARFSILAQKSKLADDTQEIETSATGMTLNGGGGVLFRLGPRLNLDVGSTFGYTHFGDFESEGTTFPNTSASGTNIVVRIGLALGLGG